jgi:hypothetical protein
MFRVCFEVDLVGVLFCFSSFDLHTFADELVFLHLEE